MKLASSTQRLHSEDVLLLVQLDQIGFLGPVPGRVSAAADLTGHFIQPFILGGAADLHRGLDVGFFGSDGLAAFRIDIDRRQAGFHQDAIAGALAPDRKIPGGNESGRGQIVAVLHHQTHFPDIILRLPRIRQSGGVSARFRSGDNPGDLEFRRDLPVLSHQAHLALRRIRRIIENVSRLLHPEGDFHASSGLQDQGRFRYGNGEQPVFLLRLGVFPTAGGRHKEGGRQSHRHFQPGTHHLESILSSGRTESPSPALCRRRNACP